MSEKDWLLHKIVKYGYKYEVTKSNDYKSKLDHYVGQYDNLLIGGKPKYIRNIFNFDNFIKNDKFYYIRKIETFNYIDTKKKFKYKHIVNNIKLFITSFLYYDDICNAFELFELNDTYQKVSFLEYITETLITQILPQNGQSDLMIRFLYNIFINISSKYVEHPEDTTQFRAFINILYHNIDIFINTIVKKIYDSNEIHIVDSTKKNLTENICNLLDQFRNNSYVENMCQYVIKIVGNNEYIYNNSNYKPIIYYIAEFATNVPYLPKISSSSSEHPMEFTNTNMPHLKQSIKNEYVSHHYNVLDKLIDNKTKEIIDIKKMPVLPTLDQVVDYLTTLMIEIILRENMSISEKIENIYLNVVRSHSYAETDSPMLYISINIMLDSAEKLHNYYDQNINDFTSELEKSLSYFRDNYSNDYQKYHKQKKI